MKNYIITILGATLFSTLTGMVSPEKWRGYVRIITGLVIISCIVSSLFTIARSDIFRGFNEGFDTATSYGSVQTGIIVSELKKRVDADIEERLKREYNLSVHSDCEIDTDENGGINGVKRVRISGAHISDAARNRLCEIYGITPQGVLNE